MGGIGAWIKSFRERRAEGRKARRAAKIERAQKKARAEAQRLEHKRSGDSGASAAAKPTARAG
jgi:Sec-independent protein translocase protein TatA